MAASFFLQFGHSTPFDTAAGLKHIFKIPPFFIVSEIIIAAVPSYSSSTSLGIHVILMQKLCQPDD